MIKECSCEHKYQDKKYGKYKRVCNPCGSDHKDGRCTVCGKIVVEKKKPQVIVNSK